MNSTVNTDIYYVELIRSQLKLLNIGLSLMPHIYIQEAEGKDRLRLMKDYQVDLFYLSNKDHLLNNILNLKDIMRIILNNGHILRLILGRFELIIDCFGYEGERPC